jgi:hypothetical protein
VHHRDIPGCFSLIDLHRQHKIPATFFFFWDYSPLERARLGKFLELKNRISKPLDIGLHDSPADAYLARTKFDGDRRAFQKWLQSTAAVEWFSKLSAAPDELALLNEAIFAEFKARVERTRELFGPITTVAAHGGELAQSLRSRLAALGAGAEMRGGLLLGGEQAGAFERNVDAELLPRQLGRIALGGDLDGAVADADGVALDRHGPGEAAVHRVETQQMRVGLDRPQVVDADDLDIGAPGLGDGAQDVAADAAEPVDGNADSHGSRSRLIQSFMAEMDHDAY